MRARKRGDAERSQSRDEEADHDDAGDSEVGNDAEISLTGRSALKSRSGDRVCPAVVRPISTTLWSSNPRTIF